MMLFSGKITNSFLVFLERSAKDLEPVLEMTEVPSEFLRDPSCWIPAADVEKFLAAIDKELSPSFNECLPSLVGHACSDLRAWGVLDSVIRMMNQPQDLFLQPQRFISYFVSPAPPIANLVRQADSISFDIPISDQEFPNVTEFLRSALEVLPKYIGHSSAGVKWSGHRITINWAQAQDKFLSEEDLTPNYKPELVQSLMHALEDSQRQLVELKSQIGLGGAAPEGIPPMPEMDPEFQQQLRAYVVKVRGQLMKLTDYLVRSQQLVTLLIGQDRMNRQVQEAMRRVDWEYIKLQSSPVAQEIADLLSDFEREVNAKSSASSKSTKPKPPKIQLQRTLDI
jgi:hypothetical protein